MSERVMLSLSFCFKDVFVRKTQANTIGEAISETIYWYGQFIPEVFDAYEAGKRGRWGVAVHSCYGFPYTSQSHCKLIKQYGIPLPMSRRGRSRGHTIVDKFLSILKTGTMSHTKGTAPSPGKTGGNSRPILF